MYDPESGNVTCDRCGYLIGNINSDSNFYSLIRTKYCPECRSLALKEAHRAAQSAYRKRKKQEKKLLKTRVQLLEEENEILRKKLAEYRRTK